MESKSNGNAGDGSAGRTHVIDITPHHGAMTKAGKANFNRFSDGSAEFVDNSLQAYKSCSEAQYRDISLRLYLNDGYRDKEMCGSYMVVADRGCGMNSKDLQEFATYSLDKETRNQTDQEFISKFGVGAKQSGFFLGDRIRVITRKAGGSILELVLDEHEFEARRVSGRKVFETEIKERGSAKNIQHDVHAPADEAQHEEMQQFVAQCELGNLGDTDHNSKTSDHFTIIIIRLKNQRVQDLRSGGRYREVPYELAQIYHFHLHPHDLPQKVVDRPIFRHSKRLKNEQILNEMSMPLKERHGERGSKAIEDEPPLNLYFSVIDAGTVIVPPVNLRLLDDDEVSQYVSKAKACFRFNMSFPEPDQNMVGEVNINNADVKRTTVQGMIFYYPFEGDKESRPMVSTKKIDSAHPDEGQLIYKGASQLSRSQEDVVVDEIEDEEINSYDPDRSSFREQATCDIYWVNRYVPQSFLRKLPLFPKGLTSLAECEAAGLPLKWRNRLKGFIFFNHSWEYISNNKLKIQVDPDIDTYINNRCEDKGGITFNPMQASSKFRTWMKACHDEFDREIHFYNRLTSVENTCRSFKLRDSSIACKDTDQFDSALFQSLNVGGGAQNQKTLQIGDNIKIHVTSKNKIAAKSFVYAKILGFDVPAKEVTRASTEHHGRGTVRYLRLPLALYHPLKQDVNALAAGPTVKLPNGDNMVLSGAGMSSSISTSHTSSKQMKLEIKAEHFFANLPAPINAINPDDATPTDKEIMSLFEDAPHSLKISLYDKVDAKPQSMNAKTTVVECSKCFYKIAVQILTPGKKLCSVRPMTRAPSASDKYKVSLSFAQKMNSAGKFADIAPFTFGETGDYWRFDKDLEKDVKCTPWEDGKKYSDAALGFFGPKNAVPSLQFSAAGTYKLRADVLDGDAVILTETVTVTVKAESIANFEIEVPPTAKGDPLSLLWPVGHELPKLVLAFKDVKGNPYHFNDPLHVLVRIESEEMKVMAAGDSDSQAEEQLIEFPIYNLDEEHDPGGKFVVENFAAIPKKAFMSSDAVTAEASVEYTISVLINPRGDSQLDDEQRQEHKRYSKLVGTPQKFSIIYQPADVCSLKLLNKGELRVANGEKLPKIEFACMDKWGHRTQPNANMKWKVMMYKNDSIRGDSADDESSTIQNAGLVTFSHLLADADQILPKTVLKTQLEFELELTYEDGVTFLPARKIHKAKNNAKLDKNTGTVTRLGAPVAVVDVIIEGGVDGIPASVQVYHNGKRLSAISEAMCEFTAGSVVSGLTVRVLDINEKPVETIRSDWLSGKGSGLILWASGGDDSGKWGDKRAFPLPSADVPAEGFPLPDIHLANTAKTYEFDVSLKLCEGKKRMALDVESFGFQIKCKPGHAAKWQILGKSLEEGVMAGDSRDLRSKIQAIMLVDTAGNYVPWVEGEHPVPKLSIRFASTDDDGGIELPESKKRGNSNIGQSPEAKKRTKRRSSSTTPSRPAEDDAAGAGAEPCGDQLELELEEAVYAKNSKGEIKIVPVSKLKADRRMDKDYYIRCFVVRKDGDQVISLPNGHLQPPPMLAWMHASSSSKAKCNDLAEAVQRFSLVSGSVRGILVRCEGLGVANYVDSGAVDVDRLTEDQISVHLVDGSGMWPGEVDKSFAGKGKKAVFSIQCNLTQTRFYTQKQIRSANFNVSLKIAEFIEKLREDSSFRENALTVLELGFNFQYEDHGETIKCKPAILTCRLQKLNLVKELNFTLLHTDLPVNQLPKYATKRPVPESVVVPENRITPNKFYCYEVLPTIRISATTDRGLVYIPSLSSLSFTMAVQSRDQAKSKDPRRRNNSQFSQSMASQLLSESVPFFQYYSKPTRSEVEDADGGFIDIVPKLPEQQDSVTGKRKSSGEHISSVATVAPLIIGNYKITVEHKEDRKQFKHLSVLDRSLVECVNFKVEPDFPVALEIQDPSVFENALAGNFIDAPARSRQIAHKKVYISCVDRFGNRAVFPKGGEVRASIRCAGARKEDLPALEGAVHGQLAGVPDSSLGTEDFDEFVFPNLELVRGVGSGNNTAMCLLFSFHPNVQKHPTDAVKVAGVAVNNMTESTASFEFITDASRAEKHKVLIEQLEPLRRRVEDYTSHRRDILTTKESTLKQLKAELDAFRKKPANRDTLLYTVLAPPDSLEARRLQGVQKDLTDSLHQIMNVTQYRAAVKDKNKFPNQAQLNGLECLGLTVDLGFIEDERVAKVCSYAAGAYMNAVICNNDAAAAALYKKKIKSWSITRMRKFSDNNGLRNAEAVKQQALPLPKIDHRGNPRYLVNLIQLDAETEHLRDTLFYAIFDRALLFDDQESALAYQKKVIAEKKRPPTIMTMQGDKFLPDGLLNPQSKMPERVPFVFGEQPPDGRTDCQSYEKQLATINILLPLCEVRDKAQMELQEIEIQQDDIDAAMGQMNKIGQWMREIE